MKLYKVIALSVNADLTNKVYESGDIVQENWFASGHAERLVETKHLEPYEAPATDALISPAANVEPLSEGDQDAPPADDTNPQRGGDQDTPPSEEAARLPVDDEQPDAALPDSNKEKATTKRTVKK